MKNMYRFTSAETSVEKYLASEFVVGKDKYFLIVGVRLEDRKSSEDASKVGFKKIDEIIYVLAIKNEEQYVDSLVKRIKGLFISSYMFRFNEKYGLKNILSKCGEKKFVRNSIIPAEFIKIKRWELRSILERRLFF